MNIKKAIEILKIYVITDRKIREKQCTNDFEKYCEENCKAIDSVLSYNDKLISTINNLIKIIDKQLINESELNYLDKTKELINLKKESYKC